MSLKSLIQTLNPWAGPKEGVSLSPVEQIALRLVLSYGESTVESIATEVGSTLTPAAGEVEQALDRLVALGLLERRYGDAYVASKRAGKLKGHLPIEPQTVTEFYL
jgi:hypothetical protein